MSDWQSMDSAPKDGTEVLLSDGQIVWISSRKLVAEKARLGTPPLGHDWYQPTIFNRPIEWQPLPKPTPRRDGIASSIAPYPTQHPLTPGESA